MPVQTGSDSQGCFAKWGDAGHKYYYKCGNKIAREHAKAKARTQGIAIGEYVEDKVSFDFDDTLTKKSVQAKARQLINKGVVVYVISARHEIGNMYNITDSLGIQRSRVFATGSNKAKVLKIKSLGITKHYDNNEDVIKQIGSIGELVKLSINERFSELIKFLRNDT